MKYPKFIFEHATTFITLFAFLLGLGSSYLMSLLPDVEFEEIFTLFTLVMLFIGPLLSIIFYGIVRDVEKDLSESEKLKLSKFNYVSAFISFSVIVYLIISI